LSYNKFKNFLHDSFRTLTLEEHDAGKDFKNPLPISQDDETKYSLIYKESLGRRNSAVDIFNVKMESISFS